MIDAIVIDLGGDPKGKGRPRFGNGRTYTPAPTVKYEAALKYAAAEVMGCRAPLDGPLEVTVIARMPIPASWSRRKKEQALAGTLRPTSKPDVDNVFKMLDALNNLVWRDDSQIVDAIARKVYDDRPSLRIEVRPVLDFMG